jgi:hypothetical protein
MSEISVMFAGYTIGHGMETYSLLGQICSKYGKKAVVIGGVKAMAAAARRSTRPNASPGTSTSRTSRSRQLPPPVRLSPPSP